MARIEDATTDPRIPPEMHAQTWAVVGVRSAVAYPIMKKLYDSVGEGHAAKY